MLKIPYDLLVPEFVLAGVAFLVLAIDLFLPKDKKGLLAYVTILGLAAAMASSFALTNKAEGIFSGIFWVDKYSHFFQVFFPAIGIAVVLASRSYAARYLKNHGEYYGLIVFSVLAMVMMAAAGELLTAYVSLELLNFSLYIMASYAKNDPKSNEAGLKYILLSAFASALLLYGISMIYGVTGTTSYSDIAVALEQGVSLQPALLMSLVFIIAGIGFKVAAAPFHMWAPDVYEGSPTPVTAYLAIGSKAAGFALLLRLFAWAFLPVTDQWQMMVAVMAVITMAIGNLVAIQQKNIKRLLAYSGIGQVGYLLVGVAALSPIATNAIVLHLVGYAASNMAAFVCVIIYQNLTGKEEISDYAGLAERAPFLALAMMASLFSLAGMPFFAGFVTKFYLFTAAADQGFLWLAGIAVLFSLISLYYYLLIMKQMFIHKPAEEGRLRVPGLDHGLLACLLIATIYVGVYPRHLLDIIKNASQVLFPG